MNRKRTTAIFALMLMMLATDITATADNSLDNDTTSVSQEVKKRYAEKQHPTPNIKEGAINDVWGVVLHHTAEPTVERSLQILSSPAKKVGTHVVIDTDGTRYIMADPTVVTFHAGRSVLNGREGCNNFTVGIEFQGNTLEAPLTNDQIQSGVEYLLPIIAQYHIPIENIVTHEMVRDAYKRLHPNKQCYGKVDITPMEYARFMEALRKALHEQKYGRGQY